MPSAKAAFAAKLAGPAVPSAAAGFYHAPAVYLSGGRMEVEHFCRILTYSPDRLCLQMPHGRLTIYGDAEDRHPYRQPPDPAGAVRAHGLCG